MNRTVGPWSFAGTLFISVLAAGAPAQIVLAPPVLFPCGDATVAAPADLDGDGDVDLVVNEDSSIAIVPNLGAGSFGPRTVYPAGIVPVIAIVAVDLDGDGDLDVATANRSQSGASYAELAVLINLGGGALAAPITQPLPGGTYDPSDLTAGDFTGDGRPELAVAAQYAGLIHVFVNNGSGVFFPGQTLNTPYPRAVCIGDLDGDGDQDLAATSTGGNAQVRIFRNTVSGLLVFFASAGLVAVGGDGPVDLVCADLDGDGDRDLAGPRVPASSTLPGTGGSVLVYVNPGTGLISPPVSYPVGGFVSRITVADLDLDGLRDLLLVQYVPARLFALRNLGGAAFGPPGTWAAGADAYDVLAADLDGDGDPDAATIRYDIGVYENLHATGPLAPYPGSGEDFHMLTGVNGLPTTGPGNTVKTARAQDSLDLRLTTPQMVFAGAPYILAVQLFPTGAPPVSPPGLPMIHLSLSGAVILINGAAGPFPLGLPASGFLLPLTVPAGLAGQSALFQAAAFSAGAANGLFAATDGHEIRFVP